MIFLTTVLSISPQTTTINPLSEIDTPTVRESSTTNSTSTSMDSIVLETTETEVEVSIFKSNILDVILNLKLSQKIFDL